MLTKKEKLLSFLNSILSHEIYSKQLNIILEKLKLTTGNIVEAFFHYNLDVQSDEGNEVYESVPNRVVLHIHNLIEGSWHLDRQAVVEEFIEQVNPKTIADIGFGVPTKYVKNLVLDRKEIKLTLFDLYESAFLFSQELLNLWDNLWSKQISFYKTNMDTLEYVGDFDLYLIQDAVEHTVNPTAYLKKQVALSPKDSKFIISLPIGPIFPRHYMAWGNDDEGRKWLRDCGLNIIREKSVFTKPEVDLFAEFIAKDYHDLYALCDKQVFL